MAVVTLKVLLQTDFPVAPHVKHWARYICGSGCHAYAIELPGNILEPSYVECELMKHRIELGAYIYAELAQEYQEIIKQYYRKSSQSRPYLNP